MRAWNGWYHVSSSTYGTWLRGDPRGWRARLHRAHVEGDYKNPPPQGTYDQLYQRSRRLLKKPPVRLDRVQRRIAAEAMVDRLRELGAEVIAASVDTVHYHILARFPDGRVRQRVGLAKKHAWHLLHDRGMTGRAWAKRCHALPIADRQHQVNVYHYIASHAAQGACVWTFRDGVGGVE